MTPGTLLRLGLACLLAALPASSSAGVQVRLADGRRMQLQCMGRGSPTVILEAAYASDIASWSKVQPQVARLTRVCAYDRAGYGGSDPGPMPRDGPAVVRDLEALLRKAGISGPLVMAGHSAGGLYVRLFTALHPDRVKGVVLADSSVEYQEQRFATLFGPGAGSVAALRADAERCLALTRDGMLPPLERPKTRCYEHADVYRTRISELDTLWASTSDAIAAASQSYGDMPLLVLTASRMSGNPAAQAAWAAFHVEVASRSSRGQARVIESGHHMTGDRPDAIVAAIAEVIAEVRERR